MSEPDPRHDTPIKVMILDTQTGEKKPGIEGYSTYWWFEGNGSCDCNRVYAFTDEPNKACKCERYLICEVTPLIEGYTLDDFNQYYPEELVKKHLSIDLPS